MRILTVTALLALAACSSLYNYENVQGSHVVRAGDTLYSIAFQQGVDYRDLAAWNNLGDPDRIYVGQRLVLSARAAGAGAGAGPTPGAASPPATRPSVAPPRTAAPEPLWQWPVRGPVLARFGERGPLATGIGIGGAVGAEIQAAAAGRVVYAGNGLPDYGQLVIIEHNANWLSAYGHNRILLVSEDDVVSRGQKIAEMGTVAGDSPRLHFEIRRNGNPVDPLGLLPRAD